MNEWKSVRLGDVATYINGYAFKPSDWGTEGLPIIRIQNLTGNDYETNFYNGKIPEKYFVKNGDVLISWSASLGVYEWKKNDALLNQHIFKVVFDKLEVDKKYFMFTVSNLLNAMSKQTHGSTMRHITKPDFDNMPFPLPPIEKQKQIARKLDKCNELILKNNRILEKYDLLIKSRFIEMFGDIQKYEKLSSFSTLITKGASPRWQGIEYTDEGTLFITSENVRERYIDYSKKKFLPANINDILPRSILKKNDVLINIVGASIGRAAIFDSDLLANINQAVALVRLDFNKIDELFLVTYLNSENALKMYSEMKKGGARDNLSLQNISDLKIPICDLKSQKKFAAFVQQIDKSKFVVQKSLEKAETLYKSLMQEYFG